MKLINLFIFSCFIFSIHISSGQSHYELIKDLKNITIQDPYNDSINYSIKNISHNLNNNKVHSGSRLSIDGQRMYFFTQNETGDDHEIAVSHKIDDQMWSQATMLNSLNNAQNNGVHFVSHDNQRLLLLSNYLKDGSSVTGASHTKRLNDGTWSKPKKLKIKGYHNKDLCSFYMNKQENLLLLAVNHKDSHGKQDIYVSFKKGNKWGKPINLGPQVNTPNSEGAMTLAPDNKTLYFSSNGNLPNNQGGYDIYKTVRLDDTWTNWSEPENIGYPYNTPYDELYYTFSPNDEYVYLSRHFVDSAQVDHSDIIAIKKAVKEKEASSTVMVNVFDSETKEQISANVVLTDMATNNDVTFSSQEQHIFKGNKKYKLAVSADGYIGSEEIVNTRQDDSPLKVHIIYLNPKKKGVTWEIENVFFAFNKATLLDTSIPALTNLVNIMNREQDLIVEISGHTDSRGSDSYNLELSDKRSEAVVNYLIDSGIDPERLKHHGYGETKPVNTCINGVVCDENSHQQNRRVELKILGFQ